MAARSVQTGDCPAVAHTPSPGLSSGSSMLLLTVNVAAEATLAKHRVKAPAAKRTAAPPIRRRVARERDGPTGADGKVMVQVRSCSPPPATGSAGEGAGAAARRDGDGRADG